MDNFSITGFDDFKVFGERLKNDVQKQIDLAQRNSINKSIDLLAYGRTNSITAKNSSSKGIIRKVANSLRLPVEHIFYRSFVAGIKTTQGKGGRGIKPYASLMIRGNDIVVSDLLLKGADAKAMYGFTTRKKKVGAKKRPNMKSAAAAARNGDSVNIAGKNYRNSYLADGSYRAKSETNNQYYMEKLGAKAYQLKGNQMLLFQKKGGRKQKLPFPVKVVKIRKQSVMNALNSSAGSTLSSLNSEIKNVLRTELITRLKKIGIELK